MREKQIETDSWTTVATNGYEHTHTHMYTSRRTDRQTDEVEWLSWGWSTLLLLVLSCIFYFLAGTRSSMDLPSSRRFSISMSFSTPSINSWTNSRYKHEQHTSLLSVCHSVSLSLFVSLFVCLSVCLSVSPLSISIRQFFYSASALLAMQSAVLARLQLHDHGSRPVGSTWVRTQIWRHKLVIKCRLVCISFAFDIS